MCSGTQNQHKFETIFTFQPTKEGQLEKYQAIRKKAKELAYVIDQNAPRSLDTDTAIRKLREAVMFANAAIALDWEV